MAVSHIKSDTIGDFTGTITGFNSQGSTTTIAATDLVRPVDWNSAHNQFYSLTGNTTGNSTASGTNVLFAGSGGISVGGSTGTIVFSVQPNYTASFFEPEVFGSSTYTTETQANGTVYFRPFYLNNYLAAWHLNIPHQVTSQSATTMSFSASVSSQTSSSGSGSWGLSGTALFLSRVSTGTAANSSQIITFKSNTYSISQGYSMSVTWSTNASSATGSWTTSAAFGYLGSVDSVGGVTTTSTGTSGSSTFTSTSTNQNSFSSSAIMSFFSQHVSQVRPMMIGIGTTLSPGEYWLGHIQSTNSGSGTYSMQRLCRPNSFGVVQYVSQTSGYMELGRSASIESSNYKWGIGSYSASSQTTTTLPLSQISNRSNQSIYFYILGQVK